MAQDSIKLERKIEIITDRPDETEAPFLVPIHFLQVETGFSFSYFDKSVPENKQFTYNTTLIRYGLLNNLELRLGTDYKKNLFDESLKDQTQGLMPLLLGAKIHIADEKGGIPQMGFIGHLRLPFAASKETKTSTTGVDFRFAFTHTISDKADLSYNLGAKWHNDANEAVYLYTVAYGQDLTKNFAGFVEIYGDLPESNGAEHYWDAGFTYLICNNLQADIFFGTGLNAAQKYMVGGGISFIIPQ